MCLTSNRPIAISKIPQGTLKSSASLEETSDNKPCPLETMEYAMLVRIYRPANRKSMKYTIGMPTELFLSIFPPFEHRVKQALV